MSLSGSRLLTEQTTSSRSRASIASHRHPLLRSRPKAASSGVFSTVSGIDSGGGREAGKGAAAPERVWRDSLWGVDMRYRQLGESGLTVSVIGLGGNNFGGRIGLEETRSVVDAALDCGVTLVDTADIYGSKGGSEELLGQVLAGRREHVVLATKFGMDMGDGTVARGSRTRVPAYDARWMRAFAVCGPTTSTSTNTMRLMASLRWKRHWRRSMSSSRRVKCVTSARPTSPDGRSPMPIGLLELSIRLGSCRRRITTIFCNVTRNRKLYRRA